MAQHGGISGPHDLLWTEGKIIRVDIYGEYGRALTAVGLSEA